LIGFAIGIVTGLMAEDVDFAIVGLKAARVAIASMGDMRKMRKERDKTIEAKMMGTTTDRTAAVDNCVV